MPREMSVQDTVTIAGVSPQEVFEAISDPSRMGRWSPENTGAVIETAGGPAPVGTSFVGANSRFGAKWHTRCVVTASDPGRRFAFDVKAIGLRKPGLKARIATWEYRLEPSTDGTTVTEVWTDGRSGWPAFAAKGFDKVVTRGSTFADWQRGNIARTLANLKKDLERTSA
ncbi:SRPBCC family protein [Allobranchiibius sp. GilTou73]|uniref:SRPBCC family protein n=1 Tax=Allobranchiibius sp. GilTou73 TaxID=2904523 RepID=UPI001F342242|nr:SRPBCC family protein [Allobranchiibius sp. GilTou73]UIJ34859.1 SRPBCC family protein [Allobranchiibius sp. GilTou73]